MNDEKFDAWVNKKASRGKSFSEEFKRGAVATRELWKAEADKILEYCEENIDYMFAAKIASMILECGFMEAEDKLKEYQKCNTTGA